MSSIAIWVKLNLRSITSWSGTWSSFHLYISPHVLFSHFTTIIPSTSAVWPKYTGLVFITCQDLGLPDAQTLSITVLYPPPMPIFSALFYMVNSDISIRYQPTCYLLRGVFFELDTLSRGPRYVVPLSPRSFICIDFTTSYHHCLYVWSSIRAKILRVRGPSTNQSTWPIGVF